MAHSFFHILWRQAASPLTQLHPMHRKKKQQQHQEAAATLTVTPSRPPHTLHEQSHTLPSRRQQPKEAFYARLDNLRLEMQASLHHAATQPSLPGKKTSNSKQNPFPRPSTKDTHAARFAQNFSPKPRECSCCAEQQPTQNFPKLYGCKHKANICRHCLATWIAHQLEVTTWDRIKCPALKCRTQLTHATIRNFAAPDVFAQSVTSFIHNIPRYIHDY